MNWTIQSLSGFDFLYNVLVGAAMFGGSGGGRYALLAMIGAVLGLFVVALKAWITAGKEVDLHLPFVGALIFMMMFGHRVSVVVEEVVAPPGRETVRTRVVDDVPIGLAVLGHFISNMGLYLSERMDQAFSGTSGQNTGIPLSQGGYGRTLDILKMPMLLSDSRSSEPSFVRYRNNLAAYYKNCTAPKLNRDMLGQGGSLWTNADMIEVIRSVSLDTTPIELASGAIQEQGCAQAWETLGLADTEKLNTAISGAFPRRIPLVAGDTGGESGTVDVLAEIDSALASLGVSSGTLTGEKMALAALIVGAADASSVQSLDGNLAAMQALMIRQAQAQRSVQWAAEESMFMRIIRPMMSFFEAITYALAPFVVFLLGTGKFGIDLARKYLVLPIWVVLWMPLLSITQLYTDMQLASALQGLDLAMQDQGGASIAMVHEAFEEIIRVAGVSGMLSAAVPSLAMMLLFGGAVAATSFAGRLQGGDHVNEKLGAGDMVSPGAALNMDHTRTQNAMGAQALSGAPGVDYSAGSLISSARSSITTGSTQASRSIGISAAQSIENGTTTSATAMDAAGNALNDAVSASSDRIKAFTERYGADGVTALRAELSNSHAVAGNNSANGGINLGSLLGAFASKKGMLGKVSGTLSNVGLNFGSSETDSASTSASTGRTESSTHGVASEEAKRLAESISSSFATNLSAQIANNSSVAEAFKHVRGVTEGQTELESLQRASSQQDQLSRTVSAGEKIPERTAATSIVNAVGGDDPSGQEKLDGLLARARATWGDSAVDDAQLGVRATSGLTPGSAEFDAATIMRTAFYGGAARQGREDEAALLQSELSQMVMGSGHLQQSDAYAAFDGLSGDLAELNLSHQAASIRNEGSALTSDAHAHQERIRSEVDSGIPQDAMQERVSSVGGGASLPSGPVALSDRQLTDRPDLLRKAREYAAAVMPPDAGEIVPPSSALAAGTAAGAAYAAPALASLTGSSPTLASGAGAFLSRLGLYSAMFEAGNAVFHPESVAAASDPTDSAAEAVGGFVVMNTLSSVSFGLLPDAHQARLERVSTEATALAALEAMTDEQRARYDADYQYRMGGTRELQPPNPVEFLNNEQRATVAAIGLEVYRQEHARQQAILRAGDLN